ncbi:MAG: RNA polymerase sigma factor [Candidatus Riflebacteria bacterium]|nr:RNA polymerase sigma factor [Candidatus Riflebacteria bacterium]
MSSREQLTDFSILVKTHLNSVVRYVRFLTHGTEDARDITQEVFLKAWQQFDPQRKSSFRAWIMTITRNMVIDTFRRRGPSIKYTGTHIDTAASNATENGNCVGSDSEFCPEGLPAFAKLPVQQREIVFMRYVEQISYGEMSQITGKSEEALRKIVSRAVSAIRKEVDNETLQQGE